MGLSALGGPFGGSVGTLDLTPMASDFDGALPVVGIGAMSVPSHDSRPKSSTCLKKHLSPTLIATPSSLQRVS